MFNFYVNSFACAMLLTFILSIVLIKSRQDLISVGHKIFCAEKSFHEFSSKTLEVDTEILKLTSTRTLQNLISDRKFLHARAGNIEKVSKLETALYAINKHGNGKSIQFANENFHKKTKLNK